MVLIGSSVTVTVGLTSATPTVLDMFSPESSVTGPGGTASLSGTVTGGIGFPTPATSLTSVLFSSTELQANLVANNNTGAYSTDDALLRLGR